MFNFFDNFALRNYIRRFLIKALRIRLSEKPFRENRAQTYLFESYKRIEKRCRCVIIIFGKILKNRDYSEDGLNYVYLAECSDGSLYAGWTTDVAARERAHNAGKGAKYTRSRLPVKIVYFEEYVSKNEALKRECAIKKLPREEKLRLVAFGRRNLQGE